MNFNTKICLKRQLIDEPHAEENSHAPTITSGHNITNHISHISTIASSTIYLFPTLYSQISRKHKIYKKYSTCNSKSFKISLCDSGGLALIDVKSVKNKILIYCSADRIFLNVLGFLKDF